MKKTDFIRGKVRGHFDLWEKHVCNYWNDWWLHFSLLIYFRVLLLNMLRLLHCHSNRTIQVKIGSDKQTEGLGCWMKTLGAHIFQPLHDSDLAPAWVHWLASMCWLKKLRVRMKTNGTEGITPVMWSHGHSITDRQLSANLDKLWPKAARLASLRTSAHTIRLHLTSLTADMQHY